MAFLPPPTSAAWSHHDARTGFEVVFFRPLAEGHLIIGATTAVENGHSWIVSYEIRIDVAWRTRSAQVTGRSDAGRFTRLLTTDGKGRWHVDEESAPHLDGCQDIDLESSAVTNALPVRRLTLSTGATAQAPAAYVRALDLRVERLEQQYTHTSDHGEQQHYNYSAPDLNFSTQLSYDEAGLVLEYPGLAARAY